MRRIVFLLVIFAMAAFGQPSPADRGYTVVNLPPLVALAGDGKGGVCGIDNSGNGLVIVRWQAGQVETLVQESQLGGAKFNSGFGVYPDKEREDHKLICPTSGPPLFLAYLAQISGYDFPALFQGTRPILTPLQPIKVQPIGQPGLLDKLFVGGISISQSATGRGHLVSWVGDSGNWSDVWLRVLELKPFSQTSFVMLRDSKETESQFSTSGASCTSGTGYWQVVAKSRQDLKASLVYFDKLGRFNVVKATNQWVDAVGCDASGVVMPYIENGTLRISRWNEGQYAGQEIPLMAGNVFAGYRLTKIISLAVSEDGTVYFVAETDKGNTVFRLAPKSSTPEVVKAPGEAPYGVPNRVIAIGNNAVVICQLEGGTKPSNFLLTRQPVITNLKADPATIEPGQPVKLSWDLAGQAKSLSLIPGILAYTGPGHYEATVYPPVTMPYTVKAEWVGGPPVTKSVTVTVLPTRPAFVSAGVVNSASGAELSPGALATVYGKGLASQTTTADLPLPIKLGGTQVQIDGVACPLLYASEGQVNFVVPREIQPGKHKMVVIRDYIISNEVEIAVTDIAPSMFSISPDRCLFVDAASYQLACQEDNPLRKGGIYFVYANGLSSACNLKTGEPAPTDRLCYANGDVSIRIGDRPAEVLFAGLAPGLLVYQINFRIPESIDLAGGKYGVVLSANGKDSPPSQVFFTEEK